MKRRNLIAAIGAVGASGAAIGTGAFTSVEAERTATVNIADEDTGLLALERSEDEPGGFVITDGNNRNQIRFDFNNATGVVDEGKGVGSDSVYLFDRLFDVTNQGAQTVYFESEFEDIGGLDDVALYVEERDDLHLDGDTAVVKLEPGHSAALGFEIDSDDRDVDPTGVDTIGFDAEIQAVDEEPDDVTILDDDGNEVGNGGGG